MIKKIATLLPLLLLLTACIGSSPLEKLNGTWIISIDDTVAANPSLESNTPSSALQKGIAVAVLEGMTLSFDTKAKTISGNLLGISFNGEPFGVVEETSDSCTLLVVRTKLACKIIGDKLEVLRGDEQTKLIFTRQPSK